MTANLFFHSAQRARGSFVSAMTVLTAALFGLLIIVAVPAWSEEASPVVATIDGNPITEADMLETAADLAPTLQQYPPEAHSQIVLDFLVNQKLMAAAAMKEGIQETPAFMQRMALMRERELHDSYFNKAVRDAIGDDNIREAYAKIEAEAATKFEVHARHILVKTKEESEAVLKELEGGADFVELAKQKSIGPSGKTGGDLGFFGPGDMLPVFYETASALEPGKMSAPVQTEYGWHVIKVEEKRKAAAPAIESIREQIVQFLVRQKFVAVIAELKAGAKIEMTKQPEPATPDPAKAEPPKTEAPKPELPKTEAQ